MILKTWAQMIQRLAVAFPQWVINRLDARSDGKGFAVKAIPFVIIFLSLASITNLAGRAYVHHGDFSAYLTGAGIAVLVPIAVLAAMLIEGRLSYAFWLASLVFAGISGTIQFNIYLIDNSWLSIAEAVAFGYGVPVSEVMLAVMEARLLAQIDEHKAAEATEAQALAEVERLRVDAERRAEADRTAKLAIEEEYRQFERRKREAELRAYEVKLAQEAEIEREKAMASIRIREGKAIHKSDSPSDSVNQKKANIGDSPERIVLRFYEGKPLASQREAADETGLSQPKISRILKRLESDEVIHRNGNGVEIIGNL